MSDIKSPTPHPKQPDLSRPVAPLPAEKQHVVQPGTNPVDPRHLRDSEKHAK